MSVKEYVKYTGNALTCVHAQVNKFCQFGGGAAGGPFYHYVAIKMKDGTEKRFKACGDKVYDAIKQCNDYLNTIPE